MKARKLILFTQSFPYGKGESFIKGELDSISSSYTNIHIFPLFADPASDVRETPLNCEIHTPFIRSKGLNRIIQGVFNRSASLKYLIEVLKDLLVVKRISHLKNLFLAILHGRIALSNSSLTHLLSTLTEDDCLYFYWATGCSYLLAGLQSTKAKVVMRFHRGDLYEELNNGYIPLRRAIFDKVDQFIFISFQGLRYFKNKYATYLKEANHHCIYLGTADYGLGPIPPVKQVLTIVSCSFIHKVKRVDKIFEALQLLQMPIRWTHFGDGVDMLKIQRLIGSARNGLEVELAGYKSTEEIAAFYSVNPVHLFINFSSSEGIPVSMMEAISFGIPLVGTDVGGTAEIINSITGVLLQPSATPSDLADAIDAATKKLTFDRQAIRRLWENKFSLIENAKKLQKVLLNSQMND